MTFARIIIYTDAPRDTLRFLEDIELLQEGKAAELAGDVPGDDIHWLELELGGLSLALHGMGEAQPGGSCELVFDAEDLDALFSRISDRGLPASAMFSPYPGKRVFTVADAAGNRFSFQKLD